jgi:ferredoxin
MPEDVYDKLAEKYRLVGDAHFMEFLKVMLTPEEGQYILELSQAKTPAEVAQSLDIDEKTAAAKMDNLTRRGLLFRGKTQYLAWLDAHQLKARVMFAAEEYTHPEMLEHRRRDERYITSPYAEIHNWFRIFERTGKPLIRIIPARKAIAANPEVKPEQVLWYEDIAQMMGRAEKIGLVPCDCRRIYGRCGLPELTCLHFGNMVDYEVGRGSRMKRITLEEAIALTDECEVAGLVHNVPANYASTSGVICNCCSDCCSTFEPAIQSGRLLEIASPSRYQAKVKTELCKGCQQCLKRCPFGAVEMVPVAGADKPRAFVHKEKCLGCGVCVVGCKNKAMTFELVRPPEFIPPKPDFGKRLTYSIY